jgi:hypothetical protein
LKTITQKVDWWGCCFNSSRTKKYYRQDFGSSRSSPLRSSRGSPRTFWNRRQGYCRSREKACCVVNAFF